MIELMQKKRFIPIVLFISISLIISTLYFIFSFTHGENEDIWVLNKEKIENGYIYFPLQFGLLETLNKVTQEIKIKNAFPQDFVIVGISSSCGCTTLQPSPEKIPTKEITTFTIEYKTPHKVGNDDQFLFIKTNDHELQGIKINLSAKIDPVVLAKPYIVNYLIHPGSILTATALVNLHCKRKLTFDHIESTIPGMTVSMQNGDFLLANKQVILTYEIPRHSTEGQTNFGIVSFFAKEFNMPITQIHVSVKNISQPLYIQPESITFYPSTPNSIIIKRLTVKSVNNADSDQLISIQTCHDSLKAIILKPDPNDDEHQENASQNCKYVNLSFDPRLAEHKSFDSALVFKFQNEKTISYPIKIRYF